MSEIAVTEDYVRQAYEARADLRWYYNDAEDEIEALCQSTGPTKQARYELLMARRDAIGARIGKLRPKVGRVLCYAFSVRLVASELNEWLDLLYVLGGEAGITDGLVAHVIGVAVREYVEASSG